MRKHFLMCAALVLVGRCYAAPGPSQVLLDLGITNAFNASLVALDKPENRAVVTAQQGTNYLAVVAYRRGSSSTNRWMLARTELRIDGRGVWVLGRRDYPHPPSKKDVSKLLRELFLGEQENEFLFTETLK